MGMYNREIVSLDMADSLASRMSSSGHIQQKAKVVEGFSIMAWDPPKSLWGKTLEKAQLPLRYNLHVILIKQKTSEDQSKEKIVPIAPGRDYRISEKDTLIIYGKDKDLEKAKHL
ncbi:MAG: hypothetical protein GKR87_00120 [Kiritimatiellae bacterium]|nr:hypothetical protein [Kiritimatiellia bacterium]